MNIFPVLAYLGVLDKGIEWLLF